MLGHGGNSRQSPDPNQSREGQEQNDERAEHQRQGANNEYERATFHLDDPGQAGKRKRHVIPKSQTFVLVDSVWN